MLSLPRLQVLESGDHAAVPVAKLPTFLRCSTSLTALRLKYVHFGSLSSEDFFRALGQSSSLKELVLSSRTIASAPCTFCAGSVHGVVEEQHLFDKLDCG